MFFRKPQRGKTKDFRQALRDPIDFLIVGLGNPGSDYEGTHHNAGFAVLDLLAEDLGVRYWKSECGALTGSVLWHGHHLLLVKPQSFMNLSGGPVKQLMEKYRIKTDQLIVIHDELDIEAGTIRVKYAGGHAGHNGLRSITEKLNTNEWYRVRIGIGRPPGRMAVVDYVLSVPKKESAREFAFATRKGADAVLYLLDHTLEQTQQTFN